MFKKNLKNGDVISLQSLSGGMAGDEGFKHRYLIGKKVIEDMGFTVQEGLHSLKGIEYISKNPIKRAEDLMFSLKEGVDLVLANIGGFDSHEIIPYLNPKEILDNATPILGFSDITSLHLYFYSLGIQTYYGPSTMDGFAENTGMHLLTKESFLDIVVKGKKQEIESSEIWTSEFLDWADESFDNKTRKLKKENHGFIWKNFNGDIEGELLGGCLDTLYSVRSKDFFPSINVWEDKVIFLETSEIKMKPQMFKDAMIEFTEIIESSKAIIFGKPKDETYMEEYIEIFLELFKKPVVFNVNIGHTAPFYTIPYGGKAYFNFGRKKIFIEK